jgi:2,3-diketo-5-methylthio-1-phosphopentane phosphatase/HAD superfamily hydrolase (TIGR01509 family)
MDGLLLKPTEETPRARTLILCDFDGTVSTTDTVNRVVRDHIISEEWRYHVKRYLRGEIGSKTVYEAVGPLMRMDRDSFREYALRIAKLDPAFPAFLQWARTRGIDVKILSDGFDVTIETLLQRHGIQGLEVFSNRLVISQDGGVEISYPHSDPACGWCGTCKRGVIRSHRSNYDKIILIGDGESDRHAAAEADMVLALKELFVYCAREGIPAIRVQGFHEVPHLLERRIEAVAFDMDGTLIDSVESIAESFNYLFGVMGRPAMTVHEIVKRTGISLVDFINEFFAPEEREQALQIFREYYDKIFIERTSIIPGVYETLEAINGVVAKGVVTNKRGVYARKLAEHFGFADKMARIIGAQDGFRAKPAGDMFEEFMRSVGAAKQNTIYVGDAPLDVEAARNAGIDAVLVANDLFPAEDLALHGPRRVLKRITDLSSALRPVLGPAPTETSAQ